MRIPKKIVVDEQGRPQEVLISWSDFQELEEVLGLDLDAEATADLMEARRDREAGRLDTYVDLDNL